MPYKAIQMKDIEPAFKAFYKVMMASEHYREFFSGQDQIEELIHRQARNFHDSLSMSDEDFEDNYIRLGLMHAQMRLPFEDMVSALTMVRDSLLASTQIEASIIYKMIERMEGFLAAGYLKHEFEEVKHQLELAVENVESSHLEKNHSLIQSPLLWLLRVIDFMQNLDVKIEAKESLSITHCSLATDLQQIEIADDLAKRIHSSHHEQHALASSMNYFYRDGDYMLANFMFSKLFAITISLSNQIGLAVSQHAIEELHYDALTGLLMRHSLEQKFQERLLTSSLAGESAAVMMLDLDHFKQINDTWGHQAGDKVLETLGQLVNRNLRQNDVAFRYGGEEFLVILSNLTYENALNVAERFRKQVEALEVDWEGQPIPLSLSIGALHIKPEYMKTKQETLIEKADQNLYRAKGNGRNQAIISSMQ